MKINANENPLGPCAEALEAIYSVAKKGGRYQYEETADFAKTMADRDSVAFAAHVSPEALFFSRDAVLRGRPAVVAGWRRFFEGPAAPFSWEPEQVEVLDSGGLAISTGPVRDPSGEPIGSFQSIWRRDADGRWRVIFDKGCPPCPTPTKKP